MTVAEAPSERHRVLAAAVRRFEAQMRDLADPGIDLHRPPRELLADLRARSDAMRRQHEALEETRHEADRLLLPELLALYTGGSDADRSRIRSLMHECRTFRWGFGWGLADSIAVVEDARRALAVFSMKDGGSDSRDQIVTLDRLCIAMSRAGLPVSALLTETASWSSEFARFPPAASTRSLLLDRARRFCSPPLLT